MPIVGSVIIDARTGIEFKRGHVPGAINAPGGPVRELYDLSASGNASETQCTDLFNQKGSER